MPKRRFSLFLLSLSLLSALAGCAATNPARLPLAPPMHTAAEFRDQRIAYVPDPGEGFNLRMYKFNYYFDRYLYLPVVRGYEFVTPVFVQTRVSDFFNNLKEVRTLTNAMLQLKPKESAVTLARFVTNSTIGIGGLFDPATRFGMERRNEDFGLTLGRWGVKSGPYLVLPVLGPSNVRDAGGRATDAGVFYLIYTAIDPLKNAEQQTAIEAGVGTLEAIDMRHQQSFRYYRSAYPFEYYLVHFLYHERRELEIKKKSP